jgi:hypothetical protein
VPRNKCCPLSAACHISNVSLAFSDNSLKSNFLIPGLATTNGTMNTWKAEIKVRLLLLSFVPRRCSKIERSTTKVLTKD